MSKGLKHIWKQVTAMTTVMLVMLTIPSLAQEQWEKKDKEGEIKDVEFEITREKQIVLPRANRNFIKVPPRPFEPIKPAITYEVKNFQFTTAEYKPSVRPLKLQQESLSKIYGNYLSVGVGNYASFFGEGAITTKRNKNQFFGAHAYTRSFGTGPVNDKASGASETTIDLFGKIMGRDLTFTGNAGYDNRGTYFYGYSPTPVSEDDRDKTRQRYSIYSVSAGIENTKESDFNYSLKVGYSHLEDHYRAKENELPVIFNSDYVLDEGKKFIFNADYTLITRTDSTINSTRHLLRVKPMYQFTPIEKLTLTLGLNLALQNDVYPDSKDFHIYPNVKAQYELSQNAEAYGMVTGDMDKVDLHTLSAENLWINSDISVFHTNRALEFRGGIKGKAGRKVAYDIGFSAASLKNYYYYINVDGAGPNLINRFNVVYDSRTERFNPYAEISFSQSENVKVLLRGDYYSYTSATVLPYHRPTYKVNFSSRYNLYDKILLEAGISAMGGMKALDVNLSQITLDPAIDLNMKARYFFSKEFSAFLQFNNMLSNNYPIYQSYPARGFQAMGGISWSF